MAVLAATATAQEQPVRGGTLRITVPEPVMLTGAFNSAGQIYVISPKIHDGLVAYDADFNLQPQLATAWTISADGKEMKFTLRPNVRWHDGKPFTSEDVAFSAMKVWKVAHPRGRSVYANLERVDTPDPLTAIFRFSQPAPYILNALFSAESQPVPRHIYDGTDLATNPNNVAPVGTGPFKFTRWERGQYLQLDRNPDYWDTGKPYLDRVVFRFIPDPGARTVAFETGEIDAGAGIPVPLSDARRLAGMPSMQVHLEGDEAINAQTFIEFNLRRPLFQDVRVRRAIAHAIDRGFIARNVYFNFATPATGPVSKDLKRFYTADVPAYPYDPALAQKLLDEAGLKRGSDGIRARITHDPLPGNEFYLRTAEYFRQAMQRIGIAVEIRTADFATWYRRIYTDNDFDTSNYAAFNLADPTMGVQRFYWSKNIVKGVAFSNGSGYANAEVDRAFELAQIEVDPARRTSLFQQMQKLVMGDVPNIPVVDLEWLSVTNRKVHNMIKPPLGPHGNFADAWMKP
ncbi:MAG: ABC transporter substrate-binding protein [Alphaproteobacteria bacterium]|nr:ABC transporter substrate-binding protein [Alphaproteobacteria bacterium]